MERCPFREATDFRLLVRFPAYYGTQCSWIRVS